MGVAVRVRGKGKGLLLDGVEHVRNGVPLEGQAPPHPHVQTHSCCPNIHLPSHSCTVSESFQVIRMANFRATCCKAAYMYQ